MQENFYLKTRRDFIDFILSKLKKRNMEILDVGTNDGTNIPILKKYGNVYAIDLNKDNLLISKFEFPKETKVMDITNLKYPKEKFDLICVFDVLEHVNDELAIKNIKKVLKKEGYCFVTVPAFKSLFSSHDKALGHKRRYNSKDLKNLFKDFKLMKFGFRDFFFFPLISLIRLIKKNKPGKEESIFFNSLTNNILLQILNIENKLIKLGLKFPFGLSIYAVFKK